MALHFLKLFPKISETATKSESMTKHLSPEICTPKLLVLLLTFQMLASILISPDYIYIFGNDDI